MIEKPVENVHTDARPHPAGNKGARLSLKEVAERAWKARMSPRLRAWVTQQCDKAGVSRGGRREKAAAILAAFRKKVPYVADPVMGEFMETPDQTLCLDEGGLCFIGTDCDGWVRMDGTTKHMVGHVAPYLREFWIEPGAEAKSRGEGDFVGMSGPHGALARPAFAFELRYPNIR